MNSCFHFFNFIRLNKPTLTERLDEGTLGEDETKFSVTFSYCHFLGLKCLREKRTCLSLAIVCFYLSYAFSSSLGHKARLFISMKFLLYKIPQLKEYF